jgi:hypothetical protein
MPIKLAKKSPPVQCLPPVFIGHIRGHGQITIGFTPAGHYQRGQYGGITVHSFENPNYALRQCLPAAADATSLGALGSRTRGGSPRLAP